MANQETKKLKFFGIGRIIPYLAKMKKLIAIMVFFGLTGSLTDIILPLFQRYALDHYVGQAVKALDVLPDSFEKSCLIELAHFTARRKK